MRSGTWDLACGLALVSAACSGVAGSGGQPVTAADFGDRWPLTVERGTVLCDRGAAIFTDQVGRQYALNGMAQQLGVKPIAPIVRLDEAFPVSDAGVRMSASALLDLARQRCQ